ncbi:hypothetical protein [Paraurantiacibacter namhicola]|nr:hypothetical protein [Paraurantiacibacter namhicola]
MQAATQLHFNNLLGETRPPFLITFSFKNGEIEKGTRLRNVQTSFLEAVAAMGAFGVEGVLMPDIDFICQEGSVDEVIAFHIHGIVVGPPEKNLRLRSTAEKMDEFIGRESSLPKGVTLRGKLPGDQRLHAENISTYITKVVAAKKLDVGKADFQRDRWSFSAEDALFSLHAWSQLSLIGAAHAVGDFGRSLRATWRRKLVATRASKPVCTDYGPEEFKANWQEIVSRIDASRARHLHMLCKPDLHRSPGCANA